MKTINVFNQKRSPLPLSNPTSLPISPFLTPSATPLTPPSPSLCLPLPAGYWRSANECELMDTPDKAVGRGAAPFTQRAAPSSSGPAQSCSLWLYCWRMIYARTLTYHSSPSLRPPTGPSLGPETNDTSIIYKVSRAAPDLLRFLATPGNDMESR